MMLEVARRTTDGTPVSMTAIAQGTHISKSYLEQLAIPLKAAALLKGRAGRTGGYTLGRAASEIRVVEVVEAAIGPISIVECVSDGACCDQSEGCESRLLWALVNQRIRSALEEYSLADMLEERFCLDTKRQLGWLPAPVSVRPALVRLRGSAVALPSEP